MRRQTWVAVLVVFSSLSLGETALAGELGTLSLASDPTAVLAGRLRVNLPPGARVSVRHLGIMRAPESAAEESRIVVDAGQERLVVMANDLFALAGSDLAASVRAALSDGGVEYKDSPLEVLQLADPAVRGVVITPASPRVSGDAALLEVAYVVLPDDTVVLLAGYVNPEGFKDVVGARTLVRRIFASASAGPRALHRAAGVRRLGKHLTITVPADVILTGQRGPDFDVYWLRPLGRLGSRPPGELGIYVGGHPRRREGSVPVVGTLLGRSVSWYAVPVTDGTPRWLEALVPLDADNKAGAQAHRGHDLVMHVFISVPDDAGLARLRAIAETIAHSP